MTDSSKTTGPDKTKSEIDLELIRENLKLSYEERMDRHQEMLDLIDELNKIGKAHRERLKKTPRSTGKEPA
ncbi:MAG: hypothetical protein HQM16_09450 [Deltaproteobacteria bacterium]|nr:hypothetical protein [Deltaproteobacteria bacterium]